MPEIQLIIDGTAYMGWQELEVVRAIDAMAGRFKLRLTSIYPLPAPRGKECELFINGKQIISGYVFTVGVQVTKSRHTLTVAGRDKTADLVDADVVMDSQEVHDLALKELVETIIEPFGVTAIFETNPHEKFKKFSFQQESAFEAIERACRMRGVFPSGDEQGNLIIRAYGATRAGTSLVMGENVLEASANFDDTDRFSEYEVYGQQPGTDGVDSEAAAGPSGKAKDLGVTRYRPKIIVAEAAVDSGLAQQRAEWEAAVRAAKAVGISVTVQDWSQTEGGDLWRENQLVKTVLPQHGINGDMLIREITYSLDSDQGTTATLALVRPDAYKKQPDLEAEEQGIDKEEAEDE